MPLPLKKKSSKLLDILAGMTVHINQMNTFAVTTTLMMVEWEALEPHSSGVPGSILSCHFRLTRQKIHVGGSFWCLLLFVVGECVATLQYLEHSIDLRDDLGTSGI